MQGDAIDDYALTVLPYINGARISPGAGMHGARIARGPGHESNVSSSVTLGPALIARQSSPRRANRREAWGRRMEERHRLKAVHNYYGEFMEKLRLTPRKLN